ncbi:hypothetical protein [Agitococcus lubricus]|uniref:Uncharacterized protein n=1 Tax=Agitococcus lubricus TaxID=1077255 RepID=A0A2T5IRR2_9GAMM|nr:hypothetical protein [Agitococcus lubricus]PTQ86522.1 hypothetical protein C8N29_1432 [Agitococcus lubricus]
MKHLFLITALLSSFSFAQEPTEPKQIQILPSEQQNIQKPFIEKKDQCQLDDKAERSGCCSHHDGVCGCSGGRAQCCDGSLSPSCGC